MDTNGNGHPPDLTAILQAVEAIYSPHSTNDIRFQANQLLEDTKNSPQARDIGFTLAIDTTKDATIRHYGLTLLDYHIKFVWDGYDEALEAVLRDYVIRLAQGVRGEDPPYLRNKIAHEWTVFAKRSWGTYWLDMDELLVQLFQASEAHREIVLYVLQTITEDVFGRDDSLAAIRAEILGHACVEIFTPKQLMVEDGSNRKGGVVVNLRYGEEGWLQRLLSFLDWSLSNGHSGAGKTLGTIGSAFGWIPSPTIAATVGIQPVCRAVVVGDAGVRLAAIEALTTICGRERLGEEDFVTIVTPLYVHDSVESLRSVYNWATVDANDIDDTKYTIVKKLAKLLSRLGSWMEKRPNLIPEESDLTGFFNLLFDVTKNISLSVSEPVLRVWSHLLRSRVLKDSPVISQSIGPLMEMCSQRLVRYEALPDDSDDPTFLFLNEDFDTIPEKHAFLGNYRRYCLEVVEAVVRKFPVDAVNHILGQAQSLYQDIQQSLANFQAREFSKSSTPFLRLDVQVMIVDAAVKGYSKWLEGQEDQDPSRNEQDRNNMQTAFTSYFEGVLAMHFKDPAIQRRLLSSLVVIAIKLFKQSRPDLGLSLLDRLLNVEVTEDLSLPSYNDAVKSLSYLSVTESQKLAGIFADELLPMYEELERRIDHKISSQNLDESHRLGYSSFLFIIIHRAKSLDEKTKVSKLKDMMAPSMQPWTDPAFTAAVQETGTFYDALGLGQLPDYLYSRNFHKIQGWQDQGLDIEGQTMQDDITNRIDHIPHRATRTLLMACFDKLQDDDPAFEPACTLWAETMPSILPNLLQSLRHAHGFGDRASWPHLPDEMQVVMNRILIDRFWQAGISTESMDDFYARVSSSKHTYEGFASTIRGTLRQVREKSYSILCYFTRLNEKFYGLPGLPETLAAAVYGTAHSLSPHQTSVLLNMSQQIIGRCPVELRQHFLPPVLDALFKQLDRKLNAEWAAVNQRTAEAGENDNLNDEMKSESILRLLTYNAVALANSLLDIESPGQPHETSPDTRTYKMIIDNEAVLAQILVFLTSAVRMRDTRSCNMTITIFSRLLPYFRTYGAVHDYLCDSVLKAAITSFNEAYFVDLQKQLAGLIAQIISLDDVTPREVILSLPGLGERVDKVDRVLERVKASKNVSQGGSAVLELLSGLRGVSIHELGKMERRGPDWKGKEQGKKKEVVDGEMVVEGTGIERGGEE
ncbi:hypothetical protein EJ08DRAFT_615639, partial [Tothia fuscella]